MTDHSVIERYYHWHSRIYDATRWSFLFGRSTLIQQVTALGVPAHILEIGCGTGRNLQALCRRFPQARLVGLDLSEDMLNRARRRLTDHAGQVELIHGAYEHPLGTRPAFDLVVFSYTLSMMPRDWENAIHYAYWDLQPGGLIAVVDFHDAPLKGFKHWMALNHVRLDGHLLPKLRGSFQPQHQEIRHAYGGLWRYFLFIGATRNH